MDPSSLIATWRRIIVGDQKSWALFENGTCVILMQPEDDLAAQAIALLKEWGPVHAGTPAGDFNVVHLSGYPGWVVTCHHPDILCYVSPEEIADPGQGDLMVGLLGRGKRDRDAMELQVVHVENQRAKSAS